MLPAVVPSYPRNVPDLLIATDSPSLYTDVRAAIEEPGTTIRWARSGAAVLPALQERVADLIISDLQIGSMGGLAIAMQVTLEGSSGRLEKPVPMVILLDRRPDTFLAKRTGDCRLGPEAPRPPTGSRRGAGGAGGGDVPRQDAGAGAAGCLAGIAATGDCGQWGPLLAGIGAGGNRSQRE